MGLFLGFSILFTGGILVVQFGLFACTLIALNSLLTYINRKKKMPSFLEKNGTKIIFIFSTLLLLITFSSYVYYMIKKLDCVNRLPSACGELDKSFAGRYWNMNIGSGMVGTASISTFIRALNDE